MQPMPGSWRTRLLMVALLVTIGPTWSQEQAPDPATSRRVARLELARSIRAFATATLAHGECQVARGRLQRRQADQAMAIALQELGISPAVLANPQVRKAASSTSASPLTRRSMTRIIQPVPSRQGVHWPQLSCL